MSLRTISTWSLFSMLAASPIIPFMCSLLFFPKESTTSDTENVFIYIALASVVYCLFPFFYVLHYLFKEIMKQRKQNYLPLQAGTQKSGDFPSIFTFLCGNDNAQPSFLRRFIDSLHAVIGPLLIWQWRQMFESISKSDQNNVQVIYYSDIAVLLSCCTYDIYRLFENCIRCLQPTSADTLHRFSGSPAGIQ